jgi:two-component system NarL family response regulator
MSQIKVLLADEKEIFREGLARLLDEQEQIEVVSKCSNGQQAIDKVKETKPDVVLIGSNISECGSIEATRQMNETSPEVKVAMLTDSKEREDLFSALEAGATGYLLKDVKMVDLIESIYLIGKGELVVSYPLGKRLIERFTSMRANEAENKDGLSERETEVLKLLTKGATNREIAQTLFITENTAKVHLKNILEKLQLRNRQQAVAYAVKRGLTDTGGQSG